MKIKLFILLTALLMIMPANCVQSSVDVSRNADESKFNLKFQVLNTSEYHTFELAAGDEIEAEIVRKSGEISVVVQKGKDNPVYEGTEPPSGTFRIGITESGRYRVTVTGNQAEGSTEFRVIREGEE